MKNIALIIPNLWSGGAERVLSQISVLLDEESFNIIFIVFDDSKISYEYSGELICINNISQNKNIGKLFNLKNRISKVNKVLKEKNIDLVISFLNTANIVNFFVNWNVKKIYSIRGYNDYLKMKFFYNLILILTKDKLLVQTERLKLEFRNKLINKKNIIVLGNPFSIDSINKLSKEPIDIELEKSLNKHDYICTVGAFKKEKNHFQLIRSFFILKEKNPNLKLIFVGGNGNLENIIKESIKNSKYKKDIIFTGVKSNPFSIMRNSKVFVLTSISEGFPNVLVEALASEAVVISTDCKTGPKEILNKYINENKEVKFVKKCFYGILVKKPKDINYNINIFYEEDKILAEAIDVILKDKILSNTYRKRALEGANRFDIKIFKSDLINIIRELWG